MPVEFLPCVIISPSVELGDDSVTDGQYKYFSAIDLWKGINFRKIVGDEFPDLVEPELSDAISFLQARILHYGAQVNEIYLVPNDNVAMHLDWVVIGTLEVGVYTSDEGFTASNDERHNTQDSRSTARAIVTPYSRDGVGPACRAILELSMKGLRYQVKGQTWPVVSPRKDGKGGLMTISSSLPDRLHRSIADLRLKVSGCDYH